MKRENEMTWDGIKLVSIASLSGGVIEARQTMEDPMSRLARDVTVWRMDTLDAQTRAGLIALGWTPPPEKDA